MTEKKRKPIGLTFNMDKQADRILDEYTLLMKERYGTPVATQFKEAMHYYMERHPIVDEPTSNKESLNTPKETVSNTDKPLLNGFSDMQGFQGFQGFSSDMLEDE